MTNLLCGSNKIVIKAFEQKKMNGRLNPKPSPNRDFLFFESFSIINFLSHTIHLP